MKERGWERWLGFFCFCMRGCQLNRACVLQTSKGLCQFACLLWHQPSGVVEFDGIGFFPFGVFPHSLLIPFFSIFFYMKYSSVKTLKSTDKFPLSVSSEWEFLFVFLCFIIWERERELWGGRKSPRERQPQRHKCEIRKSFSWYDPQSNDLNS